jgi:aldose 1-epimerase
MKTRILSIMVLTTLLISCGKTPEPQLPLIDATTFGGELDGKKVELFTLKNATGVVTQITNYGGRVVNLFVPDKDGNFEDIVLGYSSLNGYLGSNEIYYGTLIGRYGNRIANGKFMLNDSVYTLATNNGPNHLHGGIKGFNNVVWDAVQQDDRTLLLSYLSVDGEEGYPGNLQVNVTYELTDDNELKIQYWATTDKPTHVNLTHHSFFNLKGAGNGEVNDHQLMLNADYYTPVDEGLIPTGEITPVQGTPFDFRSLTVIGERIEQDDQQLVYGLGYDHNWVLNAASEGLTLAAKVVEPASRRKMEVYTNEPAIQFYGGNFLNGSDIGKYGKTYAYRGAFCLETQHYPDSPNQPAFPSTLLNPGEEYYSVCVYKFGVE